MSNEMTTNEATGQPVVPIAAGETVVVTAVNTDTTSPAFRDWVLGREGIYDRHDVRSGASPHCVRFADAPDEGVSTTPDRRWVANVQVISDGDNVSVGDLYTGPSERDHRCMARSHGRGVYCSRPKHHGPGQHVAAVTHNGEVLEVWPNQTEQPEQQVTASEPDTPHAELAAGDRVRVTGVLPGATAGYRDHLIGANATVTSLAADLVWVRPDEPYVTADGETPVPRDRYTVTSVIKLGVSTDPVPDPEPAPEPVPTTDNGSPILPVGSRIIIREAYHEDDYPRRRELHGRIAVTLADHPDADGDIFARPPHGETWPGGDTRMHIHRWEAAPETGFTASEASANTGIDTAADTGTAERVAQDNYRRLADAAVAMAVEKSWCSEFELVMRNGGFAEVGCTRQRTWALTIRFEYDLNDDQAAHAIGEAFTTRVPTVTDTRTTVSVEATVPWTGDNPSDLDRGDLARVLHDAEYHGFDEGSVSLDDYEEKDLEEGSRVQPELGSATTWVERYTAFTNLLHREALDRRWGADLADVYAAADITPPRAKTISVEVTANRTVYRTEVSEFGRALREAVNAPDHMTLHRLLRFDVDNPFEDNACHCADRVENYDGNHTALPTIVRNPVIDAARAQLRDLYGDKHAGWTADHTDVHLSCIYCAD